MLLEGKTGVILGVANKRSIAWAIAAAAHREGARLVLTYQNERLAENVRELAPALGEPLLLECDVERDEHVTGLAAQLGERVGGIDFLVHSLAFAPREALDGRYADTSRSAFRTALEVSAYSLVALARETAPLMRDRQGSIIALTYLGSERVVPKYNVMGVAKAALEASVRYLASDLGPAGIRVNAISAGPIRTLASSAVSGISGMIKSQAERAPLRKPTEQDEVADTAVFLLSPLARGITGEVLFCDGGANIMGVERSVISFE
jgi:enoyl-[acyl-carrier protein] reductase I